MSEVLLFMFIAVVVIVTIIWYLSKPYRYMPDSEILDLSDSKDELVLPWITKKEISNSEMEELLLKALKIDTTNVVYGHNLRSLYNKLTGKVLRTNKTWFDLRTLTSFPAELAVVDDSNVAFSMRKKFKDLDLKDLTYIMAVDPELTVTNYLKQILDSRWETIRGLNDTKVINNNGTYLYYKTDTDTIFGNVKGSLTSEGLRLNLLCSNLQFKTLISRWQQALTADVYSI